MNAKSPAVRPGVFLRYDPERTFHDWAMANLLDAMPESDDARYDYSSLDMLGSNGKTRLNGFAPATLRIPGTAKLTAGATRYGPALKLAESILAQSQAPRREAVAQHAHQARLRARHHVLEQP